jgi:diadenosine tetraphosphatase ApaH/serine/threonine PP2A family protein phosphatase
MGAHRPAARLAAMGGAYGNLDALEACLRDARACGANALAFLGDSIGCCGHSEQVLEMIRGSFDVLVAGNHEQQAAARAESCGCGYSSPEDEAISCEAFQVASGPLTDRSREWLGSWPERAIVEMAGGRVLLCHGSPGHTSEFLYEAELDDLRLEAWLDRFEVGGFVCTHSGLPFVRRLRGGRFVVNCGAVGKADHDGDPAVHYAMIAWPEGGAPQVEVRRVGYDHEAWARRMEAAGIAEVFVEPVRTGVWTTGVASLPASERHRWLREGAATGPTTAPRWAPERLDPAAFERALGAGRRLGLLSEAEVAEIMAIFDPAFPYCAALRCADSVHVHVKVDDAAAAPHGQLVAAGGQVENAREGYVKYVFPGGINLILSSIDVAEEDRLDEPPPPKPFVDHLGVDLRREAGTVRAAFDDVPQLARRAGWAHVPQGGLGRPVFCCHVQVGAKHWVYPPPSGARWARPIEFAAGPLVISGESFGCDLRPIDPRHPSAGALSLCAPAPATPQPHARGAHDVQLLRVRRPGPLRRNREDQPPALRALPRLVQRDDGAGRAGREDEEAHRAGRGVCDPGALLHRLVLVGLHRRWDNPRGDGRGGERRGVHPRRRHDRPLAADVEHGRAQAVSARRLVVLGAGPMGLAAALGGVRRGFDVTVLERDRVGSSPRAWGSTRFFSPLAMNLPPGCRELLGERLPPLDALLTGQEFADLVLAPLAASPPLAGRIREHTRARAVGRAGMLRRDYAGHPLRAERPFRLLIDTPEGERHLAADAVIDATGTFGQPNAAGAGGVPALGERAAGQRVVRDLGALQSRAGSLDGRRVLLLGHGHSAANAISVLASVARRAPETRAIWATRSLNQRPCVEVASDPLPERLAVVARANELASRPPAWLRVERRAALQSIAAAPGGALEVSLGGDRVTVVDEIVALTGYGPDTSFLSELALELSPSSGGASRLTRALSGVTDCLSAPTLSADDLASGEPGFHLAGSKSYGRASTFLLQTGYAQLDAILDGLAAGAPLPAGPLR